jgi:queuine/archaeosine tRNA-ribosyltransferase
MYFFPVLAGALLPRIFSGRARLEHLWWRRECPIYIPYIMISYGHCKGMEPNKELLKIDSDVKVMVDSGIDIPSRIHDDLGTFKRKAEKSYGNYLKQIELMGSETSKSRFFIILHGKTEERLEIWWEKSIEPLLDKVFGVAYPPRPKTSVQTVIGLNFLRKKRVRNVHLLGVSGYKMFSVTMLYNKHFDFLSTDSSTFSFSAVKSSIFPPYTFSIHTRIGYSGLKSNVDYSKLSCKCPVCRYFVNQDLSSIVKLGTYERHSIVSLHNLFWTSSFVDYLHWLESFGNLEKFVCNYAPEGYKLYKNPSKASLREWI